MNLRRPSRREMRGLLAERTSGHSNVVAGNVTMYYPSWLGSSGVRSGQGQTGETEEQIGCAGKFSLDEQLKQHVTGAPTVLEILSWYRTSDFASEIIAPGASGLYLVAGSIGTSLYQFVFQET